MGGGSDDLFTEMSSKLGGGSDDRKCPVNDGRW